MIGLYSWSKVGLYITSIPTFAYFDFYPINRVWVPIFSGSYGVNAWTFICRDDIFKGLRPVLEGFVVPMHEGACETGSQIPRA